MKPLATGCGYALKIAGICAALMFGAPLGQAAEIQRVVSPGGIEAWLIADDAVPIVSLAFGFRGGSALDPIGKEGRAKLASGLLDEGAGELDASAFQQRVAAMGLDLGFSASRDDFTGYLRTLSEHADAAADLLALALARPRFDAEPLERIRRQLLIGIEGESRDPDLLAARAILRELLGDDPYARPDQGTLASVQGLGADDLRAFARERLTRDQLFVTAAGDISPEVLGQLVDRAFAGLPATGARETLPRLDAADAGVLLTIERDIPQSIVAFAQPGILRDDPDFFAAYLMNYILGGGGFSSRLMSELRVKRGLTYGVSTDLVTLDRVGLISGRFETGTDKVAEALEILRQEWRRMAAEGPSDAELEAAKSYLLGSYPRNLTTTSKAAGTLLNIRMADLGIDYIDRRQTEIAAVTLDDVKRVARRLLDEKSLTIVVAGRPVDLAGARAAPQP